MINTPLVKQQIEKYIKNLKYSDFFWMWLEDLIQGSVTKNEFFTLISMIFEELEKKNIEEQTGIQIIFTKASNKSPLNGTFWDLKRFKSTEVNIFHNNYVSKFLISLLDNEYITYHYPCLRMKNWNTKGRYKGNISESTIMYYVMIFSNKNLFCKNILQAS